MEDVKPQGNPRLISAKSGKHPNVSPMRFIRHKISNAPRRMDMACKVRVQELRISGVRCTRRGARRRTLVASSSRRLKESCYFRFENLRSKLLRLRSGGSGKLSTEPIVFTKHCDLLCRNS